MLTTACNTSKEDVEKQEEERGKKELERIKRKKIEKEKCHIGKGGIQELFLCQILTVFPLLHEG